MKRTISILVIMLVAVVFCNCYGASLVGSWSGEKYDKIGGAQYNYTFNSDGSGYATFEAVGEQEVVAGVMVRMNMKGNLTFNWSKSTDVVTIKATDFNMNFTEDDITIICDNPQNQPLYDSQKSQIVSTMNEIFSNTNEILAQYSLIWKILELSANRLIVDEEGKVFEFSKAE